MYASFEYEHLTSRFHLTIRNIWVVNVCVSFFAFRKWLGGLAEVKSIKWETMNETVCKACRYVKKKINPLLSSQTCTSLLQKSELQHADLFCSSKVMNPMGNIWGPFIRLYHSSKALSLTQPLCPYTCRAIMRMSHEPSQEIVFSLKSPEQVSLSP